MTASATAVTTRNSAPTCRATAQRYLERLGASVERSVPPRPRNVLHDPAPTARRTPGALRMEWPRIPLPGWPDGAAEGAAAGARLRQRCEGRESRPAARSGNARPGCHARRIAAGDCRNRRTHNDGRTQHDWRRFCGDGMMGTFRNWRRRDAWPRPGCRASLHAGGAGRLGRDSCHPR